MDILSEHSPDGPGSSPPPLSRGRDPWSSGRPGSRTIVISNQLNEIGRESRVNLTIDEVVTAERDDYHEGLSAHMARGGTVRGYLDAEEDRLLWEGCRAVALIRPRESGDLEVIEFVGADGRTLDEPRRTISPASWVVGTAEAGPILDPANPSGEPDGSTTPAVGEGGEDDLAVFDEPAPSLRRAGSGERLPAVHHPGPIGSMVAEHRRILAEIREIDERERELEEDLENLKAEGKAKIDRAQSLRDELARTLLDRCPVLPFDPLRWCYALEPFAQLRADGFVISLSAPKGVDLPDTLEELVERCALTITPDDRTPAPLSEIEQEVVDGI